MDKSDRLYVLAERSAKLLVWDDPTTVGPHNREAPTGGVKPHLFALKGDGQRAFAMNLESNNVTVFNPHDPSQTPVELQTGEKPEGRALSNDERVLYITTRLSETLAAIDTETNETLAEVPSPGDPVRVFFDERRGRVMTLNYAGNYVGIYDATNLEQVGRINLNQPAIGFSFDPSMDHAFLCVNDDKVHVVDLDTLSMTHSFDCFKEPDGSAVINLHADAPIFAEI